MNNEIDEAVRAWSTELLAEAELGRAEVAELEDHLRAAIEELRDQGMSTARAITEAAHRLGEPRAIAREHARVRGAFGARLSPARTWSVVALLAPLLINGALHLGEMPWQFQFELLSGLVLVAALLARRTWPRAILLGGMAFYSALYAASLLTQNGQSPQWLALHVGLIAFLAPWRRRELTGAGWSLALAVWAFGGAAFALGFEMTTRDGRWLSAAPAAGVAALAAIAATCGGVLRAKWSALAAACAAVSLAAAIAELASLPFRVGNGALPLLTFGFLGSAAIAAAASAIIAWNTTRSLLGTLRAIAQ